MRGARLEVRKSKHGWEWWLVAGNNRVVAVGMGYYSTPALARRAAKRAGRLMRLACVRGL